MTDTTQATTTTTTAETEPKWAGDLRSTMAEVGKGINSLVTMAQDSQRRAAQPPVVEETETDTGEDLLADGSLEVLPRKAFAEKIMESFQSRLEAALKPIADRIDQASINTQALDYKTDALRFAEKTKDFGEWEKEMMAIAEQNPTLSIARIYTLARAENPAKAAEVDKKYAAATSTTTAEPPARGKKTPPASLTPASGSAEVTNHNMKPEEAAQDAWDKAVAEFGNPFGPET